MTTANTCGFLHEIIPTEANEHIIDQSSPFRRYWSVVKTGVSSSTNGPRMKALFRYVGCWENYSQILSLDPVDKVQSKSLSYSRSKPDISLRHSKIAHDCYKIDYNPTTFSFLPLVERLSAALAIYSVQHTLTTEELSNNNDVQIVPVSTDDEFPTFWPNALFMLSTNILRPTLETISALAYSVASQNIPIVTDLFSYDEDEDVSTESSSHTAIDFQRDHHHRHQPPQDSHGVNVKTFKAHVPRFQDFDLATGCLGALEVLANNYDMHEAGEEFSLAVAKGIHKVLSVYDENQLSARDYPCLVRDIFRETSWMKDPIWGYLDISEPTRQTFPDVSTPGEMSTLLDTMIMTTAALSASSDPLVCVKSLASPASVKTTTSPPAAKKGTSKKPSESSSLSSSTSSSSSVSTCTSLSTSTSWSNNGNANNNNNIKKQYPARMFPTIISDKWDASSSAMEFAKLYCQSLCQLFGLRGNCNNGNLCPSFYYSSKFVYTFFLDLQRKPFEPKFRKNIPVMAYYWIEPTGLSILSPTQFPAVKHGYGQLAEPDGKRAAIRLLEGVGANCELVGRYVGLTLSWSIERQVALILHLYIRQHPELTKLQIFNTIQTEEIQHLYESLLKGKPLHHDIDSNALDASMSSSLQTSLEFAVTKLGPFSVQS